MAKGVFTTKVNPEYDDLPEIRYHFPKTYLNQVGQTVGDWIVYYEPRRQDASPDGRAGRQAYFATARVERIEADDRRRGHYYAFLSDYLEFDNSVPFRSGSTYLERLLVKEDGTTNRGAFGRSVRNMSNDEYDTIVKLGFDTTSDKGTYGNVMIAEEPAEYDRPILEQLVRRPFRDAAFAQNVVMAYGGTCAVTGLRLINGGGRFEVEAAHIRPVGEDHRGPDSVRNGIALSRTVHWMFDRGLLTLTDDYEVVIAERMLPDDTRLFIGPHRRIHLPDDPTMRPHPQFLSYHRDHIFKG
ncbi:MAG TPA: HNH endonuclease [Blastocatellia bacterium]|jgi:putative restriction endonuclease|nr:HNH endonuclease [Blastocatellia bacterium]